MNEKRGGGRARRLAATLSLLGLGVTGAAGVGAYEILQASKSSTTADSASSSGLSAGSGSSMTQSGGS